MTQKSLMAYMQKGVQITPSGTPHLHKPDLETNKDDEAMQVDVVATSSTGNTKRAIEVDTTETSVEAVSAPAKNKRAKTADRKTKHAVAAPEPSSPHKSIINSPVKSNVAAEPIQIKNEIQVPSIPTAPITFVSPFQPQPTAAEVTANGLTETPEPSKFISFFEEKLLLSKHPQTIAELHEFHVFWQSQTTTMTEFPMQYVPLLAKLIQDGSSDRYDIVNRIYETLFPPLLEGSLVANPEYALSLQLAPSKDAVRRAIDEVATRVNYGKSGNGKSYIWRWEVLNLEWLPVNVRMLAASRRLHRLQHKALVEGTAVPIAEPLVNGDVPSVALPTTTSIPTTASEAQEKKVEQQAEEKRQKQEEKERKKQEMLAQKDKKNKLPNGQAILSNFFNSVKEPVQPAAVVSNELFEPFFVKPNVHLAPLHRSAPKSREDLDQVLGFGDVEPTSVDYEPYLIAARRHRTKQQQKREFKLFHFHENVRPAYYGTTNTKQSKIVKPRRPLAQDKTVSYDVDSDDEWEQGEAEVGQPGINLLDSEDEEEDEDYESEASSDSDDEVIVPDGYLSADEGDISESEAAGVVADAGGDVVEERKEDKKKKLKAKDKEKQKERKEGSKKPKLDTLVPVVIPINYQHMDEHGVLSQHPQLNRYQAVSLSATPSGLTLPEAMKVPSLPDDDDSVFKHPQHGVRGVPPEAIPLLIKMVHKSANINGLIEHFKLAFPNVSRRQIDLKISEMFVREKRPSALRAQWYLKKEFFHLMPSSPVRAQANPIPNDEAGEDKPAALPPPTSTTTNTIKKLFQQQSLQMKLEERLIKDIDLEDEPPRRPPTLIMPNPLALVSKSQLPSHSSSLTLTPESRLLQNFVDHAIGHEADLGGDCCLHFVEPLNNDRRQTCVDMTEAAVFALLSLAFERGALDSSRNNAVLVLNRFLEFLCESKTNSNTNNCMIRAKWVLDYDSLPIKIGRVLESRADPMLIKNMLKLLARLLRSIDKLLDDQRVARDTFKSQVASRLLPCLMSLAKIDDKTIASIAISVMTMILPFAELTLPPNFWAIVDTFATPFHQQLLQGSQSCLVLSAATSKQHLYCLRAIQIIAKDPHSFSHPRLQAGNFEPLLSLLNNLLVIADREPSHQVKDVQQDMKMARDMATEVIALIFDQTVNTIRSDKLSVPPSFGTWLAQLTDAMKKNADLSTKCRANLDRLLAV